MRKTLTHRTFSRPFGRPLSFGSFGLPLMASARGKNSAQGNVPKVANRETNRNANIAAIPSTVRFPGNHSYAKVRNLDALLEIKRAEHNLPAVTALTLKAGRIAAKGETGVRKVGSSIVVRPADRWHIGACAKAMTASMMGALVEQGELSWETTLGEALPRLRESMQPVYHDVTLEMLLTHRAGLSRGYGSPAAWRYTWKRQDTAMQHRRKVSGLMLRDKPAYMPGKGYSYSTMGYCIAGHMAEYVTGQSWEELMQDLVFEPLSMHSAGPGAEQNFQQIASPWGHQRDGVPIEPGISADQPAAFGPGGGNLHMSITDWSKFVADQLKGARGEEGALLSAETYRRLQAGHATGEGPSYAMGWNISEQEWAKHSSDSKGPDSQSPDSRGICLSHNGTILSWYSQVRLAPERNMAVLCATNIGDKNRGHALSIREKLNDVARAVIGEALRDETLV
ncbi:MAG: serine hydrolase domain-containing protein [Cyanobacteria bacterium J06621_11]